MAEFKFACAQCGQHIQCDTSYAGMQIDCPVCQQSIIVPSPPRAATSGVTPAVVPSVTKKSRTLQNILLVVAAVFVLAALVVGGWYGYSKIRIHKLPPGLVALWSGEGNANDSVGGNNAAESSGITYAPGKVGQGFSLNGVNQTVQIPDSPSLNFTSQLSIVFWFKDAGSIPSFGLISKRPIAPGACNFGINVSPNLQVYFMESNSPTFQISTSPYPSAGVFHHLAATFQQVNSTQVQVKTFIDGALVTTSTLTGNLANTVNNLPVTIGGDSPTTDFFKGIIDEVSLYNRALSDSEIQAIYAAQK